jgi:hypothetical protein
VVRILMEGYRVGERGDSFQDLICDYLKKN